MSSAKALSKYIGVALLILGVFMFLIPYLMDAANRAIRNPDWWKTHAGVVAYFWGSEMLWGAVGLLIAGLVLAGASFALKD